MKAMISAMALRVGESAAARCCSVVGDVINYLIPIALFVFVVASLGAIAFGFV